jgi:hypothetical protein
MTEDDMSDARKINPTPAPLDEELKAYLKHKAIDNGRTLGKEIVARLEESRKRDGAVCDAQQ